MANQQSSSPYPALAEMIRKQGNGEDTILAHINPYEAQVLKGLGGSGTINKKTGLPQFGFFKNPAKSIKGFLGGKDRTVRGGKDHLQSGLRGATMGAMLPNPSGLDDLRQQAYNTLAQDKARLAGSSKPVYRGKTTVPMSALEQRRRALEEKFRSEPLPYSNQASSVLNRTAQGFSPSQTNSLVDKLKSGSSNFFENVALNKLKKQFGSFYDGREDALRSKVGKDLTQNLPVAKTSFNQLGEETKGLNAGFNQGLGQTLTTLGAQEKAKREGLTGMLGSFGNQVHTYGNLQNQADKAAFDRETNAPYRRMGALSSLLNTYGGNADNMSPEQEAGNVSVLNRALQTYNTPTPSYRGQTVAPMTPELEQSHILLQRLNHDFQDESRNARDSLATDLTNRENVGTRAINNLSETFNPQEQNFDAETKNAIKRARNEVAASNIQRGTFGSQSHQAQTEDAIRRLLSGRFGGRSNLLNNSLRSNLSNLNRQDGSDINNLINLGRNGLNEYQTGLNNIQSLNNQGVTNWFNNQNQLNSQQQDFENEETWEWPHLQGNSNSTNPHLSGISQAGGVNYALSNPVHSPLSSINPQALNANAPLAPFNQNEPAPIAPLAPIDNSAQLAAAMQQAQRVAQQQQEAQTRAWYEAQRREREAKMRAQQEAAQANSGPTPQLQALMNKWKAHNSWGATGADYVEKLHPVAHRGYSAFGYGNPMWSDIGTSNIAAQQDRNKQFLADLATLAEHGYRPDWEEKQLDGLTVRPSDGAMVKQLSRKIARFVNYNEDKYGNSNPSKYKYY